MSELQILLMMNVDNEHQFIEYFPQVYEQPYKINELMILSKFFKNCGKGCLLNKDKIYFYKTYFTKMEKNLIKNKSKIFLLFCCDSHYNQKYIDEFTNNIFDLLEEEYFENNKLKNSTSKAINDLFEIYKDIKNKEEIYKEYVKNIVKKALNKDNENDIIINNEILTTRRRIDSRFFKQNDSSLLSIKRDSTICLIENIEMAKITENDTDLTMIFKADSNKYYMNLKLYKKIKTYNIIIFSIIGVILLFILIPIEIAKNINNN